MMESRLVCFSPEMKGKPFRSPGRDGMSLFDRRKGPGRYERASARTGSIVA